MLALAPNPWQGQWVNRQRLLSRLGVHYPIVYSTGGWFSWDRYDPAWQSTRFFGGFKLVDNVWVDESPQYLLRFPRISLIDQAVMHLQCRRWKSWLNSQSKGGALIAHIFHPIFYPYLKHLRADFVVYHAYDLFQHTVGWTDKMAMDERKLLESADLVIASSQAMADGMFEIVNREIRVLPNGVDVVAFENALQPSIQIPSDLQNIPHPRIGYMGSLHLGVDYDLIYSLAKTEPNWQFVLVGPERLLDGERIQSLVKCQSLSNIHFLGEKPYYEIPKYMVNMDVNIMSYLLSDKTWIKAIYPLKLHEYLAAGKPVVSSDLISVRPFTSVVRIADGMEDWHKAIGDALNSGGQGSTEERQAVSRENSWDARAGQLEKWWCELVHKV